MTIEPVRYFNGDSARSLGVEISVIKRTTRWLSGSASFELQRTTGTNSDADEAYLEAIYGEAYDPTASIGGLTRSPLLWDKPWTVSLNLDFSVFDNGPPRAVRLDACRPTGASTSWPGPRPASATPRCTYVGRERTTMRGDYYSAIGPWKSTVNLRFNKFWKFDRREADLVPGGPQPVQPPELPPGQPLHRRRLPGGRLQPELGGRAGTDSDEYRSRPPTARTTPRAWSIPATSRTRCDPDVGGELLMVGRAQAIPAAGGAARPGCWCWLSARGWRRRT